MKKSVCLLGAVLLWSFSGSAQNMVVPVAEQITTEVVYEDQESVQPNRKDSVTHHHESKVENIGEPQVKESSEVSSKKWIWISFGITSASIILLLLLFNRLKKIFRFEY